VIFASFEFLWLFLPVFLATYFLAPARARNLVILGFSWAFYAWWRIDFLVLLMGVTAGTYSVARLVDRAGPGTPRGGRLVTLGVVANLLVLAWFKYANFGVNNLSLFLTTTGFSAIDWTEIVLPVGLSFYVLQSVSYLVDVQRGVVPVSRSFVDYAAYKAIFAQLIAGPIVRYAEIARDLRHRTHSLAQFGAGSRLFMLGFAQKVVLADTLSPLVNVAYELPRPLLTDAWIAGLGYTLQLYFDFAGYSLMAIGLARMLGFHFPPNFNNPLIAGSIRDLWQRWHMTLSRFLRDYLYIPLGGNRGSQARINFNLIVTMAIGGLWHGASWNFLLWGLWHGILLALHRSWTAWPGAPHTPYLVGQSLTLLAWITGLVVFRAQDLPRAGSVLAGMAGLHGTGLSEDLAWQATPDRLWFLLLALVAVYLPLIRAQLPRIGLGSAAGASLVRNGVLRRSLGVVAPCAAFLLAIVLLYSRDAVPFLYFQF
jgi:alginate O-acetyltransferase complex protein AlgI